MAAFAASKHYRAFGEESDYAEGSVFVKHSGRPKAAHASISERSFGSDGSKWSVMRYYPSANFDEHIAGGIGDANSVRSDMTDNLLHDLDDLMPGTIPNFEALTESNHPRQIRLYLEKLESGLPPAIDVEEYESIAVVRILRQVFGFHEAQEGLNIVPELERLLSAEHVMTLFRRFLQLSIIIALAFMITTLPQIFGVDLPDFFMHAVFLLVMALVATVIMI